MLQLFKFHFSDILNWIFVEIEISYDFHDLIVLIITWQEYKNKLV